MARTADPNLAFDMPEVPNRGSRHHPNSYRRKDGRTVCPDCHAVTLDAVALERLPCKSGVMGKERVIPQSTAPPPMPSVGDLWMDALGIVRVLTVNDPLSRMGVQPTVKYGEWQPVNSGITDASVVAAPRYSGVNSDVVEMAVTQEVRYLDPIGDLESNYYKAEVHRQLMDHIEQAGMVAVTPFVFEVNQSRTAHHATIHGHLLARDNPFAHH